MAPLERMPSTSTPVESFSSRNTRLTMWLNEGVPPSQVAVWAGLKDSRGLYHLRDHLNKEVNVLIKGSKNSP